MFNPVRFESRKTPEGMDLNRLSKLAIESGKTRSLLELTIRLFKLAKLPISVGKDFSTFEDKLSLSRFVRIPISEGNLTNSYPDKSSSEAPSVPAWLIT